MNDLRKSIIPLFLISLAFLCVVIGVLTWTPETRLQEGFTGLFDTFSQTTKSVILLAGVVIALGLAGGLVFASFYGLEHWKQKSLDTTLKQVQIKREARLITVAAPGHQIIDLDLLENIATPRHLQPGRTNGKPAIPSQLEITLWLANNQLHASARRPELPAAVDAPQLAPSILQPILPILASKDTIMLIGNRGSGKTNLLKHLVAIKRGDYAIILIDPHQPSKICGFDTIGAGGDWPAIQSTLESIEALGRYRLKNPGNHQPIFIFVDEWRSVVKNIAGAAEMLLTITHEFRKAQVDIAIASQSRSVKALGIEGEGDLRTSFTLVECVGYEGQGHRCFITPHKLKDEMGRKLSPVEYSPPPLFTGEVITPAEVFRLPAPQQLKAEQLKAQGFSITAIARELFNTDKATGPQIQAIKEMLGEAT